MIISALVTLAVLGVVLYLFGRLPMDSTFREILRVVAFLLVLLWILSWFVPGLGFWRTR